MLLGTTPPGATNEDRAQLAADLDTLASNGAITVPHGFDLKIVESKSQAHEGFAKQIEYADRAFTIALLGEHLTTQSASGSEAAPTQSTVARERAAALAERLSTCLHDQVLTDWAEMNMGSRAAAPWPRWELAKPTDLKAKAETLATAGDAFRKLAAFGVNIRPLLDEYGLEQDKQ